MLNAAKSTVKRILYAAGALSLYHRLRNRSVLSVAMFHRVLSPADPRWPGALPTWTLAVDVFDDCLKFFKRHYTVIGLQDMLASLKGETGLPPRSLLLTFDDGYADNAEYALPLLRRHGLPAVVFISSDAVGRRTRLWTEDFLSAYFDGGIAPDEVASVHQLLGSGITHSLDNTSAQVWEIVRGGPQLSEPTVQAALALLRKPLKQLDEPAQMVTEEQVRALVRHGVAIGAHGKTHSALHVASDLAAELREPRRVLEQLVTEQGQNAIYALSFPHGAYTPEIVVRVFQEGYRLLFTNREELSPVPGGRLISSVIGRINVDGPSIAPEGRLRQELLAWHFFCRPHVKTGQLDH